MSVSGNWRFLADLMIPPDPEKGLFPGSVADVSSVLESEKARREFDSSVARIAELADTLMGTSLEAMTDALFQDFLSTGRIELEPHLRTVGTILLKAYYTDPLIRAALGLGSGAPFPAGSSVLDGDLELLEPVYNRGKIYRDVGCEH